MQNHAGMGTELSFLPILFQNIPFHLKMFVKYQLSFLISLDSVLIYAAGRVSCPIQQIELHCQIHPKLPSFIGSIHLHSGAMVLPFPPSPLPPFISWRALTSASHRVSSTSQIHHVNMLNIPPASSFKDSHLCFRLRLPPPHFSAGQTQSPASSQPSWKCHRTATSKNIKDLWGRRPGNRRWIPIKGPGEFGESPKSSGGSPGMRRDWDEILRDARVMPRLSPAVACSHRKSSQGSQRIFEGPRRSLNRYKSREIDRERERELWRWGREGGWGVKKGLQKNPEWCQIIPTKAENGKESWTTTKKEGGKKRERREEKIEGKKKREMNSKLPVNRRVFPVSCSCGRTPRNENDSEISSWKRISRVRSE